MAQASGPEILPYPTPSFDEEFALEELLGEGTYGSVWRCARLDKGGAREEAQREQQQLQNPQSQQGAPYQHHRYEVPSVHHQQREDHHHHQQHQQPQQQQQRMHQEQQQQQKHQQQLRWEGQKWYACKVVPKSKLTSKSKREDLRREVALLKLFAGQHAAIVQLHSVHESPSSVKLVMEHCAGGDLFDLLCAHGRLPEPAARHVFRQVASAMAYCHSCGVLHRDIKPENILFDQNAECLYDMPPSTPWVHAGACGAPGACQHRASRGEYVCAQEGRGGEGRGQVPGAHVKAKLADFGLSVIIGRQGVASGYTGSRFYTAPEMVRGWSYGMRADVWSLGVVLFTMLTGRLPFAGRDDGDLEGTRRAILKGSVDYDQPAWDGVSEAAKDLVRSMLRVDPSKRIHSHEVLTHPWLTGGARVIPKVLVAPPVYTKPGRACTPGAPPTGVPAPVLVSAPVSGACGVHHNATCGVPAGPALAGASAMPEAHGAPGMSRTSDSPDALLSSVPSGTPNPMPSPDGRGVPGAPDVRGGVPGVDAWAQPWQLLLECSSRESNSSCISRSTTDASSPSAGGTPAEGGTPATHHQVPFKSPLPLPGAAFTARVHRGDPGGSPLPAPAAVDGCGKERHQAGEESEEEGGRSGRGDKDGEEECEEGEEEEEEDEEDEEEAEEEEDDEDEGEEDEEERGCGRGNEFGTSRRQGPFKVNEEEEGKEEACEGVSGEASDEVSEEVSEGASEEPPVHEGEAAVGLPDPTSSDAVGVPLACAKKRTPAQAQKRVLAQMERQPQTKKVEPQLSGASRGPQLSGPKEPGSRQVRLEAQHQGSEGGARGGKDKHERRGKSERKLALSSLAGDAKPGPGCTSIGANQPKKQPHSVVHSQAGDTFAQAQPSRGHGEAQPHIEYVGDSSARAQRSSKHGEARPRIGDSQPRAGHTQTRRLLAAWFRLGRKEEGVRDAGKGKRLG